MTWSGSARASASSRAISRWVSATCRSTAPISASAARAPTIGSRNSTAGPGLEVWAVSGTVRPKSPTRAPPSPLIHVARAPPKGARLFPSRTFEESQTKRDSSMRWRSTAGPKSNSWLPKVAASSPRRFQASTIWRPLNRADISEGDRVSPESVKSAWGLSRRISRTLVARRARPPRPSVGGSSAYTSFTESSVTRTLSRDAQGAPAQPASRPETARTTGGWGSQEARHLAEELVQQPCIHDLVGEDSRDAERVLRHRVGDGRKRLGEIERVQCVLVQHRHPRGAPEVHELEPAVFPDAELDQELPADPALARLARIDPVLPDPATNLLEIVRVARVGSVERDRLALDAAAPAEQATTAAGTAAGSTLKARR